MGWFGSIHVRTQSVEHVAAAVRLLKQEECYVGKSGAEWVGVYDKRNEDDGGRKLGELSRGLSLALKDAPVLGFLQGEEGFAYWLYLGGQPLDTHPRDPVKGLLFVRRGLLDLCPTEADKDRVRTLLAPKRIPTPRDFRMTDEELKQEIERNRRRAMLAAQRPKKTIQEQKKIFPTDRYAMEIISKILGIEYFWLVYSDFSPYDLPPTFMHVDYRLPN